MLANHLTRGERVGIPLTGLIAQQFCACPNSRFGFPMPYVVVLFVLSDILCHKMLSQNLIKMRGYM